MKIADAIDECRNSGQSGWALVRFAQHLVATQMRYSYTNSFDFPATAFAKGRGYCWHQSKALLLILGPLGFRCRLVYATRNRFPKTVHEGMQVPERVSGHVWCRVTIDGEEKDVCPGSVFNYPGRTDFTPLSTVRPWTAPVSVICYFASASANSARHRRLVRASR